MKVGTIILKTGDKIHFELPCDFQLTPLAFADNHLFLSRQEHKEVLCTSESIAAIVVEDAE